jgi:CRP/FNR family cyclic AMP-dependent transcriptional regulator
MLPSNCKIEAIKNLPILSLLPPEQLGEVLPTLRHRSYAPRAYVMCPGATIEGLHFVLSGTVHVMHEDGDAREVIIATLGPGEFFGEGGLFESAPRLQSAQAQEFSEILFVPKAVLLPLLQRNPAVAMFMMRALANRLAAAQRQIASFALVDVYGRVARVLLDNARMIDGECLVALRSIVIAAMVGASREMVSRVVRDMINNGIVRRYKRKLIVLDREGLEQRTARQPQDDEVMVRPAKTITPEPAFAGSRPRIHAPAY